VSIQERTSAVAESRVSSILLVDDSPADLLALEAVLEPLGLRLVKASSGEEALEHLLTEEFSALLLAVELPGLDGFETVRLLRQRLSRPLPPLLFMAATRRDADHVRQGYALGAVDYLLKPLDADILRTKVSVFVRLHLAAHRAEEQLRFQASIRLAMLAANDALWDWDIASQVLHWNLSVQTLFGYAPHEIEPVITWWHEHLHPEDRERVIRGIDGVIARGEQKWEDEYRFRRRDGTFAYVVDRAFAVRDATGKTVRMVGAMQDISQRKHAEHDAGQAFLRAEKDKRTAEIYSRLGLAFASELDREKLVQRVTDEATELTGAAFGAFFQSLVNEKGESYYLYTLSGVPREAFERFPMPRKTRIFAPTFEGKATLRLDDVTQSPDYGKNPPYHGMPEGHLPVRSYLAVPVKSRSGAILGGLFFGHPEPGRFLKEHEQLVEGLAAQAAVALDNSLLYLQAQRAISVRDEFLQVAAHELRTPITSLKLKVQSLLRAAGAEGPPLPMEKLRGRLEDVDRIVGKLSGLINELLDISRITAGNLRLTLEEVDLAALVREVALRFEAQAAQVHVPIHVLAHNPLVGRWDRLRLEQVVTNLLSNALKYGSGRPVHIDTQADGTHARLRVRDEGIGIAPEALSRIFGRFERAVSERHYGGLGLGLYITRQIVEALGGTVYVESTPGQGSTFTVELPLEPASAGA
jgi:PAS domain S-box-containing protein